LVKVYQVREMLVEPQNLTAPIMPLAAGAALEQ
jgi:hypothetical protein